MKILEKKKQAKETKKKKRGIGKKIALLVIGIENFGLKDNSFSSILDTYVKRNKENEHTLNILGAGALAGAALYSFFTATLALGSKKE